MKPKLKQISQGPYDYAVEWREAGKRKRKFFRKEAQARGFLRTKEAELRAGGVDRVPPSALEWSAIEEARAEGVDLLEAVRLAVRQRRVSSDSVTVEEAVVARLQSADRAGRSDRYLSDLRSRLYRFSDSFDEDTRISDVTRQDVEDHVRAMGVAPTTVCNQLRVVAGLFKFAVKRGWALSDVTDGIERPKSGRGEIGILTPDEARALLDAAKAEGLEAMIAIGLFAGLRTAELSRLDWPEVREDYVEVTAAKAKTARRRLVEIEDNLRAWLGGRRREGPVWVGQDAYRRTVKRSGISPWPHNAMRHSYASYHLAKYQDASKTALMLGHSGTGVLFEHYRELVTGTDAEAYFSIMP